MAHNGLTDSRRGAPHTNTYDLVLIVRMRCGVSAKRPARCLLGYCHFAQQR